MSKPKTKAKAKKNKNLVPVIVSLLIQKEVRVEDPDDCKDEEEITELISSLEDDGYTVNLESVDPKEEEIEEDPDVEDDDFDDEDDDEDD